MNGHVTALAVPTPLKLVTLDARLLEQVNLVRAQIANLALEYAQVPDVSTPGGMKTAMARKAHVVSLRTQGAAAVKAYTKPMYDGKKAVDDLWRDTILTELRAIEDPLAEAIQAERDKEQRRIEKEQKRVHAIKAHISYFAQAAAIALDLDSIDAFEEELDRTELSDFAEYSHEAAIAIQQARGVIGKRQSMLQEQERLAEQLTAEAIALELRAAELAQERARIDEQLEKLATLETEALAQEQAQEASRHEAEQVPEPLPIPPVYRSPEPIPEPLEPIELERIMGPIGDGDFALYMQLEADFQALDQYVSALAILEPPTVRTEAGKLILRQIRVSLAEHIAMVNSMLQER